MRQLFLFCCSILLLSSCVTNKKIVYLQKDDVNKKGLPKDTAVRTHTQVPLDYRIQPNDALYVRFQSLTPDEFDFFKDDANSSGAGGQNVQLRSELVDPEGQISFPVIGKVKVAGMTVFEVQDTLQSLAITLLKSPIVKVRLVNFRFTMLGEVNAEGTVITPNNRVSLPEAIGLAGGIGDLADRANVKIIRQVNGATQVAYVNLLSEDLLESPYYYINQNDIIVVPPLRQRPFRKYFTQNLAVLLSATSVVLLIVNLSK
jgi:polysaccharide biosynthesis/export protein